MKAGRASEGLHCTTNENPERTSVGSECFVKAASLSLFGLRRLLKPLRVNFQLWESLKKKKKGKKVTRHNRYILVQSETHYYLSNGLFFYLNLKPKYCFDIQKALGGHLEMFIFAGIHLI